MTKHDARAPISRRTMLGRALLALGAACVPLSACRRAGAAAMLDVTPDPESLGAERLRSWAATLRAEHLVRRAAPLGTAAARVGELAVGTPYEPYTLEAYIRDGGDPAGTEPLILWLTKFDCVSLVESCLATARVAAMDGVPTWDAFAGEMERMRYRGGVRGSYASRLHYFSEWIADGARRGLLRDMGAELGGVEDARPLRFMTSHRESYPALANDDVYREIGEMEARLDAQPRTMVPAARIPAVLDRIEHGDVIAFATSIEGLDVTHAAFAYRDRDGVLRVLHAPLSGGVVEITRTTLPEYVANIRRATGILVARPL